MANMIAQRGVRGRANPVPLDMQALQACLTTVDRAARLLSLPIHMPRIGCGLAGGHWDGPGGVGDVVEQSLGKHFVTVYDLGSA